MILLLISLKNQLHSHNLESHSKSNNLHMPFTAKTAINKLVNLNCFKHKRNQYLKSKDNANAFE
jgi:hypothetical protein